MLSTQDIKKLTDYLKEVFATRADFERFAIEQRENFSKLQTSVDAIALDNQGKEQGSGVLDYRMKNVENWIDKASPKLGLKFKH